MNGIVSGLIFIACWFSGVYLCDEVIKLNGGWMMLAGVVVFVLAGLASGIVEINWDN